MLEPAASLFGASKNQLGKFDDYEGCANLVYQFEHAGQLRALRISPQADRRQGRSRRNCISSTP